MQEIESLSRRTAGRLSQGEYVANRLKVSVEAVENALLGNLSSQEQRLFHLILGQRSIHRQVAEVVMICKEKNPDYFQQFPGLTIFLGGGGKEAEYYRYTIESTHSAFNHQYADVPIYDFTELPFPGNDFDMSGIDHRHFHRFAVAYGLSIPEEEGSELKLPSLFPRITPRRPQPITPEIGRYPEDNSSM
ncbi:MAG: hypothetical protein DSM106950_37905 [Stigonema ocellatum SAG 48.90 = DSM 106950]|nr:hypothetical protein [Stigonema ocellatum SAG 48.90 = DSM 106950]